jgi:hypothetical protein
MLRLLHVLALLCTLALALPNASLAQDDTHYDDVISPRVQHANALYISGPFARAGSAEIARFLRAARMDAAIIDFKDGQGRLTYDSALPEFAEQESIFIQDPAALVRELQAEGIHVIGRMVCFNDRVLSVRDPSRAILDNRPNHEGETWTSWGTGGGWLNPWDERNHELLLRLADEIESFGVDEIQLDYIRFPVDEGVRFASYAYEQNNISRAEWLHGFLRRMDGRVAVPLAADVFGLAAYRDGDASGLGQDLELWADVIDVFCPMLYMNAMTDWNRGRPNRARNLVQYGVSRLRERIGPRPVIRPFLQGFENGAEDWSPDFIAEQIRGARLGGADGFMFWNPGSNFGMVQRAMQGRARNLIPFVIPEERVASRQSDSNVALVSTERATDRSVD